MLIAEHLDVPLRQLAGVVQQRRRVLAPALVRRLTSGAEDHVEPDQLLDRPVVDRFGEPPAHLVLRLDRSARQAPGAQPAGRLGGAQAADHRAGGRGREHEDDLVEREHPAVKRGVAAQGGRGHQRERSRQCDGEPPALALEVGVGGEHEQRGEPGGAVSLRHDQLDDDRTAMSPAATSG